MKKHTLSALVCAALGNGIFGFSFMFSRIALGVAQPFVMLMYRFILAFVVLAGVALVVSPRAGKQTQDGDIHWLRFDLKGKNILPLLGMGLIQPVGYFLCESYGISLTNSTFSGVIIALIPIVAIAGGAIALREIPKPHQILFSLLSIAGVILMTMQQQAQGHIHPAGVLLLLGAVLLGAYFSVLSRKISAHFSAMERTVVMMGMAALLFTLLAAVQCRNDLSQLIQPALQPQFLLSILYLGLCSSIVAFMCLNYANNYLPVARATSFANLTTMVSLFAGVVFLKEPMNGWSLLASVMIITGIYGSQRA